MPDLALPLEVERMPVLWFEPTIPITEVSVGRLPMWIIDTGADGIQARNRGLSARLHFASSRSSWADARGGIGPTA